MRRHAHPEAFCLMKYATEDGADSETLWNSRDGVTPFAIRTRNGNNACHVDWARDVYAPDHVPAVGDRIFVDLTEQRARVFAAQRVERMLERQGRSDWPSGLPMLDGLFASREEAVQSAYENIMEQPDVPDILVVTSGYLEQLEELRRVVPAVVHVDLAELGTEHTVWFDRQARPLTPEEFIVLKMREDYQRVALTELPGRGYVSTVWLGSDNGGHVFDGRPPLIFETLCHMDGQWCDEPHRRYATEDEAIAGHTEIVALVLERLSKGRN